MKEKIDSNDQENLIESPETAYDRSIRKLKNRDAFMEHIHLKEQLFQSDQLASIQSAANVAYALKPSLSNIAHAVEPAVAAVASYHQAINSTGITSAVSALESGAAALVPDNALASMSDTLGMAAIAMKPYHDLDILHSGILPLLETAAMTPELMRLHDNLLQTFEVTADRFSAISDYVENLTFQWNSALDSTNAMERSMAAQNFAVIRMFPNYEKLTLPPGSKTILKSLTKSTAKKLTQSKDIRFDPKEKDFYHKNLPDQKITADQITVAASSLDLFADITLDELISFESSLMDDIVFAIEHPVGRKIRKIIEEWDNFVGFEDIIYYHARTVNNNRYYLDQEMMKAPINISGHGRYNAIGKSCYYIAETKVGAVSEIRKHSGGTKPTIQLAGLKAIKQARIIDLSGDSVKPNRFIEHLRFTVENENGKIVKEYLLPNFVASCCKRVGIDGIRYKSTGYNCIVLWNDDYFEFEEGSREIIL